MRSLRLRESPGSYWGTAWRRRSWAKGTVRGRDQRQLSGAMLDLTLIDECFAYEGTCKGGVRVTSMSDNHIMLSDIDGTIFDLFVSCDSVVMTRATGDGTVPKITRCPRPPAH